MITYRTYQEAKTAHPACEEVLTSYVTGAKRFVGVRLTNYGYVNLEKIWLSLGEWKVVKGLI